MATSQGHRTKNSKNNQTNLSIRIIWIGYIASGKWSARKSMNMKPLYQEQNQTQGDVL